jgi:non-specific serine/threonine protein kinase
MDNSANHTTLNTNEAHFSPGGYIGSRDVAKTLGSLSSLSGIEAIKPPPKLVIWEHNRQYCVRLYDTSINLLPESPIIHPLHLIITQSLKSYALWHAETENWILRLDGDLDFLFYVFSLLPEASWRDSGQPVQFIFNPVNGWVDISWQNEGAFLEIHWKIDQKGKVVPQIFGSPPTWICQDNVFRPLSSSGRKLAQIFERSPRIFLSLQSLSPLLELYPFEKEFVVERNEELRPEIVYVPSTPVVTLRLLEEEELPVIEATLDFKLKPTDEMKRVIYVPETWDSGELEEVLSSIGFTEKPHTSKFIIREERCLDLIAKGRSVLPNSWEVHGLDSIQGRIKISTLSLNVSLKRSKENEQGDFICDVSLIQNNGKVPLSSLFRTSMFQGKRWTRLDNGSYARIPGGGLSRFTTLLNVNKGSLQLSNEYKVGISSAQALGMVNLESDDVSFDLDDDSQELLAKIRDFDQLKDIQVPHQFVGTLREYQQKGVSWMSFLKEFHFGGILADEMGLGKTVQTLALLQHVKNNHTLSSNAPTLIVCPTSVVVNWLYEAQKFTPELKTLVLHGPDRKQYFYDLDSYDLVITTYPLVRIDRHQLKRTEWQYIILDEAQYIKNPGASTTQSIKTLPSVHRLALTGTPTENRPLELWSIFDFLMPGFLGSIDQFKNQVEKSILDGNNDPEQLVVLKARISPFILRRTKAEVEKDLPPKVETELHTPMTPLQQDLYNQILEEVRPKVFDEVERKGIRASSISILAALLRLRQVCNHPCSIEAYKNHQEFDSGKFQMFQSLLEEAIDNNRKILVFSQFKEMLRIIREWLDSHSLEYLYLDGNTSNRQKLIDTFNNDESKRLFLISLKAGGTGLNLTAADTVILYDPWWNPAVENQAIDRAHRIGQTKSVNVYRLVTENSIEQHIFKLKERKNNLFNSLIGETGESALSISRQELEQLFSFA